MNKQTANNLMIRETASPADSGAGFLWFLTIVFIALKLTGYIDWSWWWVLSPLWVVPAIVVATIGMVLIVAAILIIIILLLDQ